jgi:uncharacterized protein
MRAGGRIMPCMTEHRATTVSEALRQLVVLMVDHPDAVNITVANFADCTMFTIDCDPRDCGKIIGKQGRTARSLRTLLGAIGMTGEWRYLVNIEESPRDKDWIH